MLPALGKLRIISANGSFHQDRIRTMSKMGRASSYIPNDIAPCCSAAGSHKDTELRGKRRLHIPLFNVEEVKFGRFAETRMFQLPYYWTSLSSMFLVAHAVDRWFPVRRLMCAALFTSPVSRAISFISHIFLFLSCITFLFLVRQNSCYTGFYKSYDLSF